MIKDTLCNSSHCTVHWNCKNFFLNFVCFSAQLAQSGASLVIDQIFNFSAQSSHWRVRLKYSYSSSPLPLLTPVRKNKIIQIFKFNFHNFWISKNYSSLLISWDVKLLLHLKLTSDFLNYNYSWKVEISADHFYNISSPYLNKAITWVLTTNTPSHPPLPSLPPATWHDTTSFTKDK